MRHYYLHYVDDSTRLGISGERLRALVAQWRSEGPFELSFDDAHRSMLDAAPILRELEVTPTLFVPTGFVDTSDHFLDWDGLRALRDQGWRIGSHTVSHPRMRWRLYDEDEAAHLKRLVDECRRSRETLERQLGLEITLFAYPFGEDPPLAREAVKRCGYERAFTVAESLDWNEDPFSVPRLDGAPPIVLDDGRPTTISVVVPAYERAEILAEVVTRLAAQTYPEDAYEVIVVDDGSESELEPIFAEMPANVRLLRPKGVDATFRAGQARQYGALRAKYDVLAFLDADVAVGEDFLWHLDWVHRRNERTVLLGYLSGYNLHDLGFVHTIDDVRGKAIDDINIIPDRSREPSYRRSLDNLDWLETPWELCYTGNLSLPRTLLDEVGGFAADFRGWGLEDVDLGVRLHEAGATWVSSRWAMGLHLVDPSEPTPRNPFRKHDPEEVDFEGFLLNLDTLAERHHTDDHDAMAGFVARAKSDIAETCGRPNTVGIEMGGASSVRGRYHHRLHKTHPGGVPLHEMLDRVAYAEKVGAKRIYMLGGAVGEHPGFLTTLEAAAGVASWVAIQSLVFPFAKPGLASAAKKAGLGSVDAIVFAMDELHHERVYGPGTWDAFRRGWDALLAAEIEVNALLVVGPETVDQLPHTLKELHETKIVEVNTTDSLLNGAVRALDLQPVVLNASA